MSSAEQLWRACAMACAVATAGGPANADAAVVAAQCEPGEEQLFACSTGTKRVAVCASQDWSAATGYVQYRYGAPHKAEMVLPAQAQVPAASALSGVLALSGGGGAWLRFRSGYTEYVVYTAVSSSWGERSGIVVERGRARLRAIACRGEVSSVLGPEVFRRGGFQADSKEFFPPE